MSVSDKPVYQPLSAKSGRSRPKQFAANLSRLFAHVGLNTAGEERIVGNGAPFGDEFLDVSRIQKSLGFPAVRNTFGVLA
jgi:hypothetical protein